MTQNYTYTVAFYNIENLFDTVDDAFTDDNDFLPHSTKRWTEKRYQNKLRKLGQVISQIGEEDVDLPPAIVGLAEVENEHVVRDLIHSKYLKHYDYDLVHYDSSDERGIDVALIYDKTRFKVVNSEPYKIYIENSAGERDHTRDILLVTGELDGSPLHIIVNHWSSRREGEKETEYKRLTAANVVNTIIKSLKDAYHNPQIIVMGDFNDNPNNISIESLVSESLLYNPFTTVWTKHIGSLAHYSEWNLFDQILFSTNFFDAQDSPLNFSKADVFDSKFLTQYHGKYKGEPFRTYVGKRYKGGYSDHFPVYIEIRQTL